jgi:16S rRNA (adenine1518-N6/adenine1519-N6)-dimethyltransferase
MDVLEANWSALASQKGGKLNIIGNLPYHITSQIFFSFADHYKAINRAVVTTQWEVITYL